jgi:hypothetical protein
VKTWRHYLQGSPISLTSDHKPLLEIRKQKQLSDKQARWVSYLESFDYNITYKAGELLIGPDALSRRPDHFKLVLDYLGATVTISELAEAVETADRYDGHNIVGDLAITGNWIQTLMDSYKSDQLFLKTEKELAEKSKPRSPFYISNGLLFFKDRDKPSPARLYVPDNSTLRNSIISEVHDLPIAGHFSRDKTLQRLQRSQLTSLNRSPVQKLFGHLKVQLHTVIVFVHKNLLLSLFVRETSKNEKTIQ